MRQPRQALFFQDGFQASWQQDIKINRRGLMGCGERKQDPTATHTLSIFREACFPAVFLALISQHTALKGARLHLLLIATGSIIFSSPLHPSFCTLKPLQVSVWQQGCPHGAQPCPVPRGSACLAGKPTLPWEALRTPGCLSKT